MERNDAMCQIWMSGEMTRHTVTESRDKLLAPLGGCRDVVVDLSRVSELDHAGLEIMLLARTEANAKGMSLHFVNLSAGALMALESWGLTDFFLRPASALFRRTAEPGEEVGGLLPSAG